MLRAVRIALFEDIRSDPNCNHRCRVSLLFFSSLFRPHTKNNQTTEKTQLQPVIDDMKAKTSSAAFPTTVSAVTAGFLYFAVVFGTAFVLGTIRVLVLVPRMGEFAAVLTEIPIILTVSWKTMLSIVRNPKRNNQLVTAKDRLVMSLAAFAFLMLAELTLSVLAFGKTTSEFLQELTSSTPHIIGLVGQSAFGLFPLVELVVHPTHQRRAKKV